MQSGKVWYTSREAVARFRARPALPCERPGRKPGVSMGARVAAIEARLARLEERLEQVPA